MEEERLLRDAERPESLFFGVAGWHALRAVGDFGAGDVAGAGDLEGVLAFGNVEEVEGFVLLADVGGDELRVVVGVVDFDVGGVDRAAGGGFVHGSGDGVEGGEGDLDVVSVGVFAFGDLDWFGVALTLALPE